MIQKSISVTKDGTLAFAGIPVEELARKYGTPFYVMDENRLRENMAMYRAAMGEAFGEGAMAAYAGKALCCKRLYRILAEEGLGADVVSGGELYTAQQAGFPMSRVFFHGNNKADWELDMALELDVFCFMADNEYELERLNRMAAARGRTVNVILRLTPGVDPHTYAAVNTGKMDCQFGRPIETGQAMEMLRFALSLPQIRVLGVHCHLGSQIFSAEPYLLAVDKMTGFLARAKAGLGYEAEYLSLGGGFGVRYTEDDPEVDIPGCIAAMGRALEERCAERGLRKMKILLEPGRSVVADAGMTVYRAGAVKEIRDHRTYVVVDGGMTDNPRYALYRARYTVFNASRMNETADFTCTIAGRCCESGALVQENVTIPQVRSGDLIAVAVTGAYNYSMASNYNRLPRLPLVMVRDGKDDLAVRRETLDDLVKCDL